VPIHNGVQYSECVIPSRKSPRFTMTPDGVSRMSGFYWMDWADVNGPVATTAFLGTATVGTTWDGFPARYIARTNPFTHPNWDNSLYVAKSLDAEGDLPEGMTLEDTANYDEGLVTLGFESIGNGYRLLEDAEVLAGLVDDPAPRPAEWLCLRNMEVIETSSVFYQTFPGPSGLRWGEGADFDDPVSAANYVYLYETDITLKWWPVPIAAYNEVAFLALAGKTNENPFPALLPGPNPDNLTSFLGQKPARTLVMGTPAKEVIRMGDSNFAYRITLRMKFYPNGANKLFHHRPRAGNPRYLAVRRPDGSTLFADGDYDAPFVPPAP